MLTKALRRAVVKASRRRTSTLAAEAVEVSEHVTRSKEWEEALPYEMVPGPKALPFLGNNWRFIPGIG